MKNKSDEQNAGLPACDGQILEDGKMQACSLFDYNIVLIGFMGSGKSTISGCLSQMLGMETVEMDQIISRREGMSISEIFEVHGEEYFRKTMWRK